METNSKRLQLVRDTEVGLLRPYLEAFLEALQLAGYAEATLRWKRRVLTAFARWLQAQSVQIQVLSEAHIAAFIQRAPRHGEARKAEERSVLEPFLGFLRREAGVRDAVKPTPAPSGDVLQRYVQHLRDERGLTEQSISIYSPFVRVILAGMPQSPGEWDAGRIQSFLLGQIRGRSSEYTRLLATVLRSLLRFLHGQGGTLLDLSTAVPMVRKWRQASIPAYLTPAQVEQSLATVDRSTSRGRRDHAILLLLARLGLRAGEVTRLELGDLRWRAGEILVRGKGQTVDCLPLLPEVGDALALYLRMDRGESASRRVFLRVLAPRVGLTGPSAIGCIARKAFARAGIHPGGRVGAHLFRHSLATQLIRSGASIPEISEVLRHRSQSTTELYAKVDFEALRGVARPWPGDGGGR